MKILRSIYAEYRKLEAAVIYLIAAKFCLQLVNASFFILFNYFMEKEGYLDYEISGVIKERFFAVMLLAAPLGFFIKGKRLKPLFYIAGVFVPIFSLLAIYCASNHYDFWLFWCMRLWGGSFIFLQVTSLPFILLNVKKEQHSEAISLSFQTMGATVFTVGVLNFVLNYIDPLLFDEKFILQLFSLAGFLSLYFISKINIKENISEALPIPPIHSAKDVVGTWRAIFVDPYDWGLIFKAAMPTLIIAVGAGFTIPVINLFFFHIHGVDSSDFSLLSAATFILVVMGMAVIPYIRKRFGYRIAITLFQSLSIFALFMMATTEYYSEYSWAVYIAVFFYVIRQPLMNVAMPMTSELMMYYVGKRNQEMISALSASIWSGSWFVSLAIFTYLRKYEFRYVSIFLITVVLYIVGVLWYVFLINDYERREKGSREGAKSRRKNDL